jgi:hypothetical protein
MLEAGLVAQVKASPRRRRNVMTTTIDAPGLAKAKFAGIKALKEDLRPYLQPEDYEHIHDRLEREVERWDQRKKDLAERVSNERYRRILGREFTW